MAELLEEHRDARRSAKHPEGLPEPWSAEGLPEGLAAAVREAWTAEGCPEGLLEGLPEARSAAEYAEECPTACGGHGLRDAEADIEPEVERRHRTVEGPARAASDLREEVIGPLAVSSAAVCGCAADQGGGLDLEAHEGDQLLVARGRGVELGARSGAR